MNKVERNELEALTRLVISCMQKQQEKGNGFLVPVGVSNRHIHLSQEHVEALFGPGYQLTKKKELMGGQFASNECCTIVGLKLRAIENVRVLGPARKSTQVEISSTARVVVLMPPAVPPGLPPTNIRTMLSSLLFSHSISFATVLKPAVRGVTLQK